MLIIRKAKKEDIHAIVNIHLQRFTSFFLTSLGSYFLAQFYKAFLHAPAMLIVIEDEGRVRGFAAGSLSNENFFKKLLKNNIYGFFTSGSHLLVKNPLSLVRIFSNANKSDKKSIIFAELLSIATERNKKMYGKLLLEEFEREIRRLANAGIPLSLTTDYDNNEKAVQFYKDCGYEVYEVFDGYAGRKMYRFIKYDY